MITKDTKLIIPTLRCNNNCLFCSTSSSDGVFTPLKILKRKVIIAKNDGKDSITLFGGEPTIHPDFLKLVKFIGDEKLNLRLDSNLRLLSYKKFAKTILKYCNVISIQTSIHGHTAKIHDSITRTKGSFDQTIKALRNLSELGFDMDLIVPNTVMVKQNIRHLEKIVKFETIDLGLRNIKFSFLEITGRAKKNLNLLLPKFSEIKPYLNDAFEFSKSLSDISFSIEKGPLCICPNEKEINYIFEPELIHPQRFIHSKKCNKCSKISKCMGIYKEYLDLYGDSELGY